ncbi:MAG: MBL fold metallo-hydrolase [Chloroflexi bacterium]|nr:MBL fold metallo-hydrolase [Chloroflexota bacterium]
MELSWLGHNAFRLTQRGKASVLTDPYDPAAVGLKPIKSRADVVTVSRRTPEQGFVKGLRGVKKVLDRAGEYEIGGVFIIGVQVRSPKGQDPLEDMRVIFALDYEGLTVAHLGGLHRVPAQAEIEALGPVQVALLPIAGDGSLKPAQAAEVVSLLEPNIVVPMGYTPQGSGRRALERFLKEMGVSEVRPQPTLKVTASSLPTETQVVVLEPRLGE